MYSRTIVSILTTSLAINSGPLNACSSFASFFKKNPADQEELKKNNIKEIDLIYRTAIDPHRTGKLDVEAFSSHLRSIDDPASDFLILNWEGIPWKELKKSDDIKSSTLLEYKKSIDIAKSRFSGKRLVGYYGLPIKKYEDEINPVNSANAVLNLENAVDLFFPSAYLSLGRTSQSNKNIVLKYLRLSLNRACSQNKPIYAFILHRWHKASKSNKDELIPRSVFRDFIQQITALNIDDCKYDGIVWWSADFHYYEKGIYPFVSDVSQFNNSYENYAETVTREYAEILSEECNEN